MTAIHYPDCEATSPGGRYALEARSPHNGTIRHKDGRKVAEDEFGFRYRQHQDEFRYRLLDHALRTPLGRLLRGNSPRVVWERWQPDGEDSPGELVVSDDGWAVIRTHGFYPEVIAVAPDGRDVARVRVVWADAEHTEPAPDRHPPVYYWSLEEFSHSTAGNYWAGYSWRTFFRHAGDPYFVWRSYRGRRLVLDLARGSAFTDEASLPAGLAAAAVEAERAGVVALLGGLSGQVAEVRALLGRRADDEQENRDPLLDRVRLVTAALHLVGVHRLRECVPYLREWETVDCPSMSTGSTAMQGRWSLQYQLFRPIVHRSLKRLGEEPRGYATYRFVTGEYNARERFEMPECLPDRAERLGMLTPEMPAEVVLGMVGSPDFVRRNSRQEGRRYRWSEDWDYDLRDGNGWRTVRLHWEDGGRAGELTAIEDVPPYWLDGNERESEFLAL